MDEVGSEIAIITYNCALRERHWDNETSRTSNEIELSDVSLSNHSQYNCCIPYLYVEDVLDSGDVLTHACP